MIRSPMRMAGAALTGACLLVAGAMTTAVQAKDRLVRLDAVMAEGKEPIYDAMAIDIWRLDEGRAVERIAERHAAPAEVALETGRYRVVADYRNARRVADIEIGETGVSRHVINLNAGRVQLNLLPKIDGEPVRYPLDWEIRQYRRGSEPGRQVAKIRADRADLLLAEGWYEVRVRHRDQTVRHVVQVAAGTELNYAIVMNQ